MPVLNCGYSLCLNLDSYTSNVHTVDSYSTADHPEHFSDSTPLLGYHLSCHAAHKRQQEVPWAFLFLHGFHPLVVVLVQSVLSPWYTHLPVLLLVALTSASSPATKSLDYLANSEGTGPVPSVLQVSAPPTH